MKRIKSYDEFFTKEQKQEIVNDYVENGLGLRDIYEKYHIKSKMWVDKLLEGKKRTLSEANKLAHKKYPNNFKLSVEAKEKIRKARLKWMKEHPEQTAWRQKNMSYPEKCFQKILEDNGLDKKYLIYREYSVFPYFIDFAFVDEKLAVEIDGSQHIEEERKKSDEKKDELLISKGWKVLRIAAIEVTHNGTKALDAVLKMLNSGTSEYAKVGILKAPKTRESKHIESKPKIVKVGILKLPKKQEYIKKERGEDGLTDKQRLNALKQRKVERPTKEELWEMVKTKSFLAIANHYGVSDNAIKKWCKQYGLPYKKKDIDKLIWKEHKYSKELHICSHCGKEYYTTNHNSKFCCNECYKAYIKENGSLNKRKACNWIHKINEDSTYTNKRVGENDIEEYISQGWLRGRKLK